MTLELMDLLFGLFFAGTAGQAMKQGNFPLAFILAWCAFFMLLFAAGVGDRWVG